MAKIINLPTLRKLTKHDQEEFLIQLFEMREKLDNVVDLISDQQLTTDLRDVFTTSLWPSNQCWRMRVKWYARLTPGKNDQEL